MCVYIYIYTHTSTHTCTCCGGASAVGFAAIKGGIFKCHDPDFLGFSKQQTMVVERFMQGELLLMCRFTK